MRVLAVLALALAAGACAGEDTPDYVVRLDLDEVAAATAARDAAPGFESLSPGAPAPPPRRSDAR